ncbi:hypothetical protein [Nocardiopsis dassonvillei]|uniref:hypothetical protein n=1 Tax=Nocardiopsis dassonvillei TaxID=2014 RepID=UPI003F5609B3
MPSDTATVTPGPTARTAPVGELAGHRYRIAQDARQLTDTYWKTRAALDRLADAHRLPSLAHVARPYDSPVQKWLLPQDLGPSPMPVADDPSRPGDDTQPPPRRVRSALVWTVSATLLLVLLAQSGADLLVTGLGVELAWAPLGYLPGLLLATVWLTAGSSLVASGGGHARTGGRTRSRAGILVYLFVCVIVVSWPVMWVVAVVGATPVRPLPEVTAGVLTAAAVFTVLPAQIRHHRSASSNGRRTPATRPWDGVVGALRSAAARRRVRVRRERAGRALLAHTQAWERVLHECHRVADPKSDNGELLVEALGRLGSESPTMEGSELAANVSNLAFLGNSATAVRCLARYHPSVLGTRFDAMAPAPGPVQGGA